MTVLAALMVAGAAAVLAPYLRSKKQPTPDQPGGTDARQAWTIAWPKDGMPVCNNPNYQTNPAIDVDGAGNVYIVWYDYRNNRPELYAQKLNQAGSEQWKRCGVRVASLSSQFMGNTQKIVTDGKGGAIVIWEDSLLGSSTILAQRIKAGGTLAWQATGVAIGTTHFGRSLNIAYPYKAELVPDLQGGAIVAWNDYRQGIHTIYAQQVDASGNLQWTATGVEIGTTHTGVTPPMIVRHRMIADGNGGAILTWKDSRQQSQGIYVQKVNNGGSVQWPSGGVPVCTARGGQGDPDLATDGGGGAVVVWYDLRNAPTRPQIYGQSIDTAGKVRWAYDGEKLCGLHAQHSDPLVTTNGHGGAILGWADDRNTHTDIFAQWVDTAGTGKWKVDGLTVSGAAYNQGYIDITSDGTGGAFLAWLDYRNPANNNRDIYLQKIDAQGNTQLRLNGEAICTVAGSQGEPYIAPDAGGGVFIVWSDPRNGGSIFAQRVKLVWI